MRLHTWWNTGGKSSIVDGGHMTGMVVEPIHTHHTASTRWHTRLLESLAELWGVYEIHRLISSLFHQQIKLLHQWCIFKKICLMNFILKYHNQLTAFHLSLVLYITTNHFIDGNWFFLLLLKLPWVIYIHTYILEHFNFVRPNLCLLCSSGPKWNKN